MPQSIFIIPSLTRSISIVFIFNTNGGKGNTLFYIIYIIMFFYYIFFIYFRASSSSLLLSYFSCIIVIVVVSPLQQRQPKRIACRISNSTLSTTFRPNITSENLKILFLHKSLKAYTSKKQPFSEENVATVSIYSTKKPKTKPTKPPLFRQLFCNKIWYLCCRYMRGGGG